jgi:hypothetical protein
MVAGLLPTRTLAADGYRLTLFCSIFTVWFVVSSRPNSCYYVSIVPKYVGGPLIREALRWPFPWRLFPCDECRRLVL